MELLRVTVTQQEKGTVVITIECPDNVKPVVLGPPQAAHSAVPAVGGQPAEHDGLAQAKSNNQRMVAKGMLMQLGVKDPHVLLSRYHFDDIIRTCQMAREKRGEIRSMGGYITKILQRGARF